MAKMLDFPNKIITIKEGLEIIKELIGFFTGKLQILQGKMNILSQGFEPYIPPILDTNNKLRDWQD